jgi:hypothetical protein
VGVEGALVIIDQEIARLNEAKRLLAEGKQASKPVQRKRGVMSPEGRAHIAAAQKTRWATFHRAKGK